ncbi:ABC transporter permease subunit [Pyrobaculum calidifontis]|uniref:Uncharacterized protein n=1 Tax=Pyrobaculum calidifontis (strain DSM 21063 / JCM 11548 / VA1) TaxID=410359 RepID=A3MXI2_PYRCJ|nr:ABC transporter permease subunit [Pyrobaculum calidifontis]ABO09349.1 hypothetical protein Pcal_1933 [Pyrobaculum calidifontis JCM 11548]
MVILLYTLRQWLWHRWVVAYAVALASVSIFVMYGAFVGLAWIQPELYGRVALAVVNASIFLVSLTSLLLGLLVYQDDQEGMLEWFLARPVSKRSYLLQRWLGLSISTAMATLAAYLASFIVVYAVFAVSLPQLLILGLSLTSLSISLLSLGFSVSLYFSDKAAAMGAGFLIWLYLTYVHDLVLMVIGPSLAPGELFVAYVINPIGAARFLAMYTIDSSLSFLNPITAVEVKLSLGDLVLVLPAAALAAPAAIFIVLAVRQR